MTHWWSRGDLNRRSCLAFSPMEKGPFSARIRRQTVSENNSLIGFSVVTPLKLRALRKAPGNTKRTVGSNPLCSSNEALRTGGFFRNSFSERVGRATPVKITARSCAHPS